MLTQFPIRVLASEAPRDATMGAVAPLLPRRHFPGDRGLILEPPPQTLALQDADLQFGHVQPTCMDGRIVKLDATQERGGGLVTKYLLKAGADMRVEVVQHHVDRPGSGVHGRRSEERRVGKECR